jgi:hypothetical protein
MPVGLLEEEISSFTVGKIIATVAKKCGGTFTETKGTAFYRLRTDHDQVSNMISLMKHGCPPQAIVSTYGYDERTVSDWYARGGEHCRQVHEAIVGQGQVDIQHVQADELCVRTAKLRMDEVPGEKRTEQDGDIQPKPEAVPAMVREVDEVVQSQEEKESIQGKRKIDHMWMAMAMDVGTRLWLGGVVDVQRNKRLILSLAQKVRSCAKNWNFLLSVDGLSCYASAFMFIFSWLVYTGGSGRPRRETAPGMLIVQVVKEYARGRVARVTRRILRGSAVAVAAVLKNTGCAKINTSFIERLNATFRGRLSTLVRKGRAIAHTESLMLEQGMYLTGCTYNFCYFHDSLRILAVAGGPKKWIERTPAMAAGLTDHRWTMKELLGYKTPSRIKTYIVHG